MSDEVGPKGEVVPMPSEEDLLATIRALRTVIVAVLRGGGMSRIQALMQAASLEVAAGQQRQCTEAMIRVNKWCMDRTCGQPEDIACVAAEALRRATEQDVMEELTRSADLLN